MSPFEPFAKGESAIRVLKVAIALLRSRQFWWFRRMLADKMLSFFRNGAIEVRQPLRGRVLLHQPESDELSALELVVHTCTEVIPVHLATAVLVDA